MTRDFWLASRGAEAREWPDPAESEERFRRDFRPNLEASIVTDEPAPRCCIACGSQNWLPLYRILEKCSGCGLVRAADFPREEDCASLYSGEYFSGAEYGDYLRDTRVHEINFSRRFGQIQKLVPRIQSMMEIGCAHGLWLKHVTSRGINAIGYDVSVDAVRYAVNELQVNAVAGDFLTVKMVQPVDVVCMWDTIEHLSHPDRFLDKAASQTCDGGWLFLTTGDIGALAARLRGSRWRMIHPPTHLYYFDRTTIAKLLRRSGYEVRHVSSEAVYRTVGSVLRGLAGLRRGSISRFADGMLRVTPSSVADQAGGWVNLGDIMFVAAQRFTTD